MSKPIPQSPLARAAEDNDLSYLKTLLSQGADVNAPQEPEALTHLMWAVMNKNAKIIEALLAHKPDLEKKDNNGWTALMYAARANEVGMVRMFLEAGADIDARDKSDLHAGSPNAGLKDPEISQLLLEYAVKREAAALLAAQVVDGRKLGEACHAGIPEKISVTKPLQIKSPK